MDQQPAELVAEVDAARRAIVAQLHAHPRCAPLPEAPVTMQQLRLLMLLRVHGPVGGHQLARHLDVSMPTVSGLVDRLVERGLVERRPDPGDRRVRLVGLSDQGHAVVAEYEAAGWGAGEEILQHLATQDLRALAQGLTALAQALSAHATDAEYAPPPPAP
ncbi:MarR family transcriptional regulator [Georgenia sp. 311]|uniref:MarR family transcriptional regulator n=1 Tax=Georgenia wutianyii TaxID=2585135 RepID=A0ABX5VJ39_9MICO|nr:MULTISPECIES: MarR family transcriptional regulator [Georgenia]QDB78339.1 MarR family transcriptional regulator [Georgenia wutianyii]TNC18498.1 MarR family transcriptional regulator [Georgenia sp. 311]